MNDDVKKSREEDKKFDELFSLAKKVSSLDFQELNFIFDEIELAKKIKIEYSPYARLKRLRGGFTDNEVSK